MANLRVDKITSTETFETTGSVYFDGTNDGLTVTDNDAFDLGTDDFTIEGWYYISQQGSYLSLFDWRGSGADGVYPALIKHTSGDYIYFYVDGKYRITNVTIQYNTWFHVTVCRSSGITKLFLDGKEKGRFADTLNYISRDILLGISASNSNDLAGNISNYRVVKGRALYTSNFKIPMRELENVPGTILLCCQSKTDATLEKTGKTITANGNAVAVDLSPGLLTPIPKSGGGSAITGSVEFTGGTTSFPGGYLTTPNNTDLRLGTSDFTVEAWVNLSNGPVDNGVIAALWDNNNNQRSWNFYYDQGGNTLYFAGSTNGSSGNNSISASIDIEDNNWYHVAVVKSGFVGNNASLYVNGIRLSTAALSGYYDNTTDLITIGAQNHDNPDNYWKGYISNLRIVKEALYSGVQFIPPTRELKNVPNTVLLCCQDPNNPLTEATGKTLNPQGNIGIGGLSSELVTSNSVWTLTKGGGGATDWTVSNNGKSLAGTTVSGGFIRATYTLPKGDYQVSLDWTGGAFAVQDSTGYIVAIDGTDTEFSSSEDGAYSFIMTETTSVVITGTSWSTAYTVDDISIKRIYKNNGASNFTPQVGDDRKVTFEGVTKINSDAYFYLPTGDTLSREATGDYNAGTRGLFGGGLVPTGSASQDNIQYINIATTGDAKDFGDLTEDRYGNGALASNTRALWAAGLSSPSSSYYNVIDYVNIASTGDAIDFGDIGYGVPYYTAGVSNATRGIWGGGYNTPASPQVPSPYPNGFQNEMEYVTMASTGNAQDFGDFTARNSHASFNSPIRGCFAGGASPTKINTIEYVNMSSTGNALNFGDLIVGMNYGTGCSNSIRAIVFGGYDGDSSTNHNVIQYVTMASTGNANDFGDLPTARSELGACSSATRGVVGGGWSPAKIDEMEYITIASTGNAQTFGELENTGVYQECGTSNGHGGLG